MTTRTGNPSQGSMNVNFLFESAMPRQVLLFLLTPPWKPMRTTGNPCFDWRNIMVTKSSMETNENCWNLLALSSSGTYWLQQDQLMLNHPLEPVRTTGNPSTTTRSANVKSSHTLSQHIALLSASKSTKAKRKRKKHITSDGGVGGIWRTYTILYGITPCYDNQNHLNWKIGWLSIILVILYNYSSGWL